MLSDQNLSVIEKRLMIFVFIMLLVALFLNLGIYPLTLEEPRRGLIALEMIFSDNWIVPTQTGELYFKKPPVYNWVLIMSYKLFGSYSELATRFFSVASFVFMGAVLFRFCRKHIAERVAAYSTLLFLVSVDILFYFSTLGEIDLFYSLLTLLVFTVIYDFGERQHYYGLFMLAYFLSALGFLTKGLPSLPFVGISLLVYFLMKRDFKRLISFQHLAGIAVFIAIVGGYFWAYSLYEDPSGWTTTLLSESSDRAVKTGFMEFLNHLVAFPLDTLKNLLPAALLIPFLFRKDLISIIKQKPFILYLTLIFIANLLLYLFSTGARSRYIYALYPLAIAVITYLFLISKVKWKEKFLKIVSITIPILFILGAAAMGFIPQFEIIDNLVIKSVLLIVAAIAILIVILKFQHIRLIMIVACFVLMRFGFSLTMPVIRAETSGATNDKRNGVEIARQTMRTDLYLFKETDISRAIVYYIEAGRKATLTHKPRFDNKSFWICSPTDTTGTGLIVHKTFESRGEEILLVTKKAQ